MATKPTAPFTLMERLYAEAFGTFVLVAAVMGTAIFSSANTGLIGPAFAIGLGVMVAAYAVGHVSGGHFNPAVTIGVAVAGRVPWSFVIPYIVAQIVGGIVASTFIWVVAKSGTAKFYSAAQASGFASNGYGSHSPGGFGLAGVIVVELILTIVFLYVILGVTSVGSTTVGFAPLAIGITLTVIHLISIPVSNTSVNPARSIAAAIYAGPDALGQLWVFILVPLVGGAIAGLTFKHVFAVPRAAAEVAAE
jgi:aquaporin Z